jgi:hypothetical protein
MSYNDPAHWRARAEDMRARANAMKEGISKHMLRRIAEDYERLARTAEQRISQRDPGRMPAARIPFAPRRKSMVAPPTMLSDAAIPSILKRGPAIPQDMPLGSAAHHRLAHDRKARGRG